MQGDVRFVNRAVVAVVEDENFWSLRDFTRDANGESVGIGGGKSKLPEWKSEAARQFFADPNGVFGGEHERDAAFRLTCNPIGETGGRMAGHRSGIAEAEIDVFAAVHVGEVRAVSFGDENRKSSSPLFHPVHGDAAHQGMAGALVEGGGFGMFGDELRVFAQLETLEAGAVD